MNLSKTILVEVTVEVTAADIAGARTDPSPTNCPVARALVRTVPLGSGWKVTRAKRDGHWVGVGEVLPLGVCIRLSRAVGRFSLDFDDGRPVAPFSFRIVR